MSKYFSISELTSSREAVRRGIDNTPPPNIKVKLQALIIHMLDPAREAWGGSIAVNSGFRSPSLNTAIGGAQGSQHCLGEAADITTGNPADNKLLFDLIIKRGLPFDQLIDESNYAWIHVSYSPRNRRQVLHLKN